MPNGREFGLPAHHSLVIEVNRIIHQLDSSFSTEVMRYIWGHFYESTSEIIFESKSPTVATEIW